MKEIGSEYAWPGREFGKQYSCLKESFTYDDKQFVFSGRTAIEYVLKDIGEVKKALIPSYCCQSMIDPFIDSSIEISFFDVNFINGKLDIQLKIPSDCNILFWCNYFGFSHQYPENEIKKFQKNGGIVIEDITQSFLSESPIHNNNDYFIASLRKWGAMLSGGVAYKKKGKFFNFFLDELHPWFLKLKKEAMMTKYLYLKDENSDIKKEDYLNKFARTNSYFDNNYQNKQIDNISLKLMPFWWNKETQKKRKRNAKIIYDILYKVADISFMFPMESLDCPLFVPIIIETDIRNLLRKKLIEHNIFCPFHWPLNINKSKSNIYSKELSLICDQRYSEKDIELMVKTIKALLIQIKNHHIV